MSPALEERAFPGFALPAGIVLLGVFSGFVVAVTGLSALYLCAAMIGCAFILRDFRIGVVLLILLMPISNSTLFPHMMLGVLGLNPLNVLLVGTLAAYLLRGVSDGSLRRFVPRPMLWLYIVPMLIAGTLGLRHFGEIVPILFNGVVDFHNVAGYFFVMVGKPLFILIFAMLVGAAAARSEKPENFLIPMLISIWVMCSMVIVFVYQSGVSLGALASSTAREFMRPLGMHANELGRMYEVSYALLLFTWAGSKESKRLRFALLVSMAPVVLALMLTFSRGAFLAFIVVNVLFLIWSRNAKTLIVFGLLAAVGLLLLPEAVYDRVATGFEHGSADPVEISAGRIEYLWLPLLPEVWRSPIYGQGLGSILWSDAMRRGTIQLAGHPHNAYLAAILDMGIVGLTVLGAYFAHVWKGLRALSADPALSPILRGFYLGAAAGLAGLLVAYFTDASLLPKPEQAFLWLAIGMMYGQRARAPVQQPGHRL